MTIWVHVLKDDRVRSRTPMKPAGLTVGRRAFCDLVLDADGVPPLAGRLAPGPSGEAVFQPGDGSAARTIPVPGHLELAGFTLALEERSETAGGPLLERVLELAPRLWAGEGQEVLPALLETLLGVFDAPWGAFLELAPGREPAVVCQAGARPGGASTAISTTVLAELRQATGPVLVADVQADPAFSAALSIPLEVRSVIAAPLGRPGKVAGLVYLESPTGRHTFGRDERDLLGRICRFAADHLERARATRELSADNERLGHIHRAELAREHDVQALVGEGPAMRRVIEQVRQVAGTDVTTLILGETGTGKELVAKAIHSLSERQRAPFVAVNCMALPDDLVEGELFGHVKGAFSGAGADRIGRFEMAHRGTLFLDEVGELSLRMQVKLLRVLQEKVIQRLGEGRDRAVDSRLVAATNADLSGQIAKGTFREDLYYRLRVYVIELPPLRERLEDLPVLVDHFVQAFNRRFRHRMRGVDPDALEMLRRHRWPGNVRELRNVLEQAFVRETADRITPASLSLPRSVPPTPTPGGAAWPEELEAAKAVFERAHIGRALELEKGKATAAAKRLGLSRANLYKKCALYGLDPGRFKG